jgi:hypothetical protein
MLPTPPAPAPFLACPTCGAVVLDDPAHVEQHVTWHEGTKTLGPKHGAYATAQGLRDGFETMRQASAAFAADEDAPTTRIPALRETVRRRPPVPDVRELRGAELLHALGDALERDGLSLDDL